MINEEIARKLLSIELKAAKITAKEIYSLLKKLINQANKAGGFEKLIKTQGSEVKLKDMVKKGQLEEIEVSDEDMKNLKKELNRYGVKFSVMKDKEKNTYSVFFQGKDAVVMERAFKNVLRNAERKEEKKQSIRENITKFKEKAKETMDKDKVKNKHKEQSL